MPELKRAELIQGTVFLSLDAIGSQESDLDCLVGFLLTQHRFHTPGSSTRAHATWVMGPRDVAQPDIALFIRPDHGGATRIEEDRMHGVPELLVEITQTSSSRDLGIKLELYQTIGVSEYLTVLIETKTAVWRRLLAKNIKTSKRAGTAFCVRRSFPASG